MTHLKVLEKEGISFMRVINPGILRWVYQTLVKCGDHVIPSLARVGALSTLQ